MKIVGYIESYYLDLPDAIFGIKKFLVVKGCLPFRPFVMFRPPLKFMFRPFHVSAPSKDSFTVRPPSCFGPLHATATTYRHSNLQAET